MVVFRQNCTRIIVTQCGSSAMSERMRHMYIWCFSSFRSLGHRRIQTYKAAYNRVALAQIRPQFCVDGPTVGLSEKVGQTIHQKVDRAESHAIALRPGRGSDSVKRVAYLGAPRYRENLVPLLWNGRSHEQDHYPRSRSLSPRTSCRHLNTRRLLSCPSTRGTVCSKHYSKLLLE